MTSVSAYGDLATLAGSDVAGKRPWVTEVSEDSIRHFAVGVGDLNPRWADPTTGTARLAPPLFALAGLDLCLPSSVSALPQRWRSVDWTVDRLLVPGDPLSATARIVATNGNDSDSRFDVVVGAEFFSGPGDRVAAATVVIECGLGEPVEHREPPAYDPETVARVEEMVYAESYADQSSRWESVAVGDALPPIVRGPVNHFDVAFHLAGIGFPWRVGESNAAWQRAWLEDDPAREQGLAGASLPTTLPLLWASTLITNWLGPQGAIERLQVELPESPMLGDVVWLEASVARTWRDDWRAAALVGLQARDQRDVIVLTGTAEVSLPD